MTDKLNTLRESGWNGFIGFSIKAKDTEDNQQVHDAFLDFSKIEAKDDRTLALRLLLANWNDSARFDTIWDYVGMLEERLSILEQKVKQPIQPSKEDEKVMF